MRAVAEAHSIDFPSAGSPLVSVKFGPSTNHDGVTVAFIHVDEVLSRVLYFLDVNVRAEPEDVGVVVTQDARDELD